MSLVKLLSPFGRLLSYLNYKADRLRLAKLMARGLKVGKNVYIMEGVSFDWDYPFLIEIGDDCRISKGVRILAHDATTFRHLGVTRLAPVRILDDTFIGERALIMPGVSIGPRTVVAAGSFVNRDFGEGAMVAGNPARAYGKYDDLLKKYEAMLSTATVFRRDDVDRGRVPHEDVVRAVERAGAAFSQGVPVRDPFYVNADYSEMRAKAQRAYEGVRARLASAEADSAEDGLAE
jgi:maltose O-acetyltransferase